MAITWSSSGSTDWSVDANWSGGVAPTSSDDVIFNATSVIACSLSAASVCKSLTTTSAYTGAFSTNSKSLTISGSCSFDNTSALTINSTITLNADGDFHIGTNITSFTGGGTIDLSLPPDIQKVFREVNKEFADRSGKQWDDVSKKAEEWMISLGKKIISLSPEENAKMAALVRPLLGEYVENMKKQGLPGQEALDFCLAELKKLEK